MSRLSVSHNDLDGVSAQIVIRQFTGEVQRMNLSYGKIDEYINIIDEYCGHTKPSEVWITDLSFTLPQLEKLFVVVKKYTCIKFYFIDHHPFSEDYSHIKSDNLVILISQKASATKLTYLFLKNNRTLIDNKIKNDLERYIEFVDAYDLWKKDDPLFKGAMVYNELFWEFKKDYYFTRFKDDFKLRNSDKERFKGLMNKKKKLFEKLDKSGRIFRHEPNGNKRILMIFVDDYKNHIPLDYPGFDIYIMISSYGGISVRLRRGLSNDGVLKNAIVNRLLENPNVQSAGGHNEAFGANLFDTSARAQVEFGKFLLTVLDEELDNFYKKEK